jgi:hypothetical protein
MNAVQWSYSGMKTFQTCAKQYKHKYILKDVKDPGNDATRYGTDVHKAVEEVLSKQMPHLPPQYKQFAHIVGVVDKWPGARLVELKMALDSNLEPCDFFDKNYFVRGVVDLAVIQDKRARILDWKTGATATYADPKQLELMALMLFAHYPTVDEVWGGLVFLVADKVVPREPAVYLRSQRKELWRKWLYEVRRIEVAVEKDNFGPSPSGLCKRSCPVLACSHNGRNLA